MITGFLIFSTVFVTLSIIFEHFLEKKKLAGLHGSVKDVKEGLKGELVSHKLRVYGTPDGVINEGGKVIPVERKSLSKKARSRHIFQLAVYMALLEESTGKPVPYGYLILGKDKRQKKVFNSDDLRNKVRLKALELVNILEGLNKVVPDPYPAKCKSCSVKDFCDFKVIKT